MAHLNWHPIDNDGTVRFRSAGHISATILRAFFENYTGFDVELFGTAAPSEDPDALQPIRAQKMVLMHASKHLHELFTVDGYIDSHQTQYKLTEIGHETLSGIVKFVYTDELNFSADCATARMQKLLVGAKFLIMPDLANACEAYLASDNHLRLRNCMNMLRFARKYACLSLLVAVLNMAATNLPYFINNLTFLNLTKEEVSKLLLSEPVVTLTDGDQRCRTAIAWLNHDRPARDACVSDILDLVPFDSNTISIGTLASAGNNSAIREKYAEKLMNTIFDGVKTYRHQRDEQHRDASNRTTTVSDVLLCNAIGSNRDTWYVLGGANAERQFVMYDVRRRCWSKLRDLPWARTYAGACVMAYKTVVVFGGDKDDQTSADIDQYDLSTHKWATTSSSVRVNLGVGRNRIGACAASDQRSAFIFGGMSPFTHDLAQKLLVCDDDVDGKVSFSLEALPKMTVGRYNAPAVFMNDAVFIAGGCRVSGSPRLSSIEKYDCISNKWTTVGSMKCGARSSLMAAALGSDDLYLAGGFNGSSSVDVVEVFDTRTGQIRQAPSMLGARNSGSGVALDRNTFCVLGGAVGLSDVLSSVECFDIREGKWTTAVIVPDMPTANRNFGFACV